MELERHSFKYFLYRFRPDLVGITMSATDHDEGSRLAKIAKENGIATVLGGYHLTLVPDELLSHLHVDMVIRGEGEHTIRKGRTILSNHGKNLNPDNLNFQK